MFKKQSDRQLEAPAQPLDLVGMMERPGNRRPIFALASLRPSAAQRVPYRQEENGLFSPLIDHVARKD